MIDPGQVAVGIIVALVVVGTLLYVFYSRTNAVEKTGYGALMMLAVVSLMIPVFWIVENNQEIMAQADQHLLDVQRGAALYGQYCYQCHGTLGQGYLSKNGYTGASAINGFTLVKNDINPPSAYETAVAQESTGQFGAPVDMTKKTAVSVGIIPSPAGATCMPACFSILNLKVKVGTVITWTNQDAVAHTVTAIQGTNVSQPKIAPQIFDSGVATGIQTGKTFTYRVTMAAYNFNPDHTVIYYCQYHPSMLAELTIAP